MQIDPMTFYRIPAFANGDENLGEVSGKRRIRIEPIPDAFLTLFMKTQNVLC